MGYDSTNFLPKSVKSERVEDLLKLLGYRRYSFRENSGKRSGVFHYYVEEDYRSLCGVRVSIRRETNGVEVDTRTNIWCSEDDMRVQNLTIRRLRDYLGGRFETDFGRNRYFKFSGDKLQPPEAGCARAFSRFGHNMVRMGTYVESRQFTGEHWKKVGKLQFLDELNPRIFSNNALVPYMVAAMEEYFQATFVALLTYSESKLAILKNSRIRPEDLLAVAEKKVSVEQAISEQFSFQSLDQVDSHFRALDKRLDLIGTLKRPFRRRKISLYESLISLIAHRHEIIHRSDIATDFDDAAVLRALEDLETAITCIYQTITTAYGWHFIQDWNSAIRRLKRSETPRS